MMTSRKTLKTARLLLSALAGTALGVSGCEVAPGTYTAMGTQNPNPNAPGTSGSQQTNGAQSASTQGASGSPTSSTQTSSGGVYTATPIPSNQNSAQNPSYPGNPFDPLAASIAGVTPLPQSEAPYNPQNAQSSDGALHLYGEALARSMTPRIMNYSSKTGGQNMTQVSFAMDGADFDPDISPDGTKMVYASTQHKVTSDIYIKSIDGRVVTQLTSDPANDVMPKISPDGGRVAFASNRSGNWDIYVMPITGGRAIQLTNTAQDDLHPSWSPDGNRIAFCRLGEVSGQWEIWITDVGNSGVASFVCYGLFPTWCPVAGTGAGSSDKIAFQKSRERGDRAFGIWTIDVRDGQAGNLTEIASTPLAACINPAWSRDGQWLAFATVPNPQQWAHSADARPASADLWLIDINANSRISLSAGTAVNLMPAWGPNNKLFFVSDRGGIDNVWSMETNQIIQLASINMKPAQPYVARPIPPNSPVEINTGVPRKSEATAHEATVPGETPRH
jgi:Tol biopolymer transport system component